MDWDGEHEVIRCGRWNAQVVEAQIRVGGYGGEERRGVWAEGGAVGAGVRWECVLWLRTVRVPLGLSVTGEFGVERGRTIFIVPSQELEQNVSLETRFQCTANTSRLWPCQFCTGNLSRPMSKSLIEPSPQATTSWFSCSSDHATS